MRNLNKYRRASVDFKKEMKSWLIVGKVHIDDILIPCTPESISTYQNNTSCGNLSFFSSDQTNHARLKSTAVHGPHRSPGVFFFLSFILIHLILTALQHEVNMK